MKIRWTIYCFLFSLVISLITGFFESARIVNVIILFSGYKVIQEISNAIVFAIISTSLGMIVDIFKAYRELKERVNATDKIQVKYYE